MYKGIDRTLIGFIRLLLTLEIVTKAYQHCIYHSTKIQFHLKGNTSRKSKEQTIKFRSKLNYENGIKFRSLLFTSPLRKYQRRFDWFENLMIYLSDENLKIKFKVCIHESNFFFLIKFFVEWFPIISFLEFYVNSRLIKRLSPALPKSVVSNCYTHYDLRGEHK